MQLARCKSCNEHKSVDDDFPTRDRKRAREGVLVLCKKCLASKHAINAYGLTLSHKKQLTRVQGGICRACRKILTPSDNNNFDICVQTGSVFAIICQSCKLAVTALGDDLGTAFFVTRYMIAKAGRHLSETERKAFTDLVGEMLCPPHSPTISLDPNDKSMRFKTPPTHKSGGSGRATPPQAQSTSRREAIASEDSESAAETSPPERKKPVRLGNCTLTAGLEDSHVRPAEPSTDSTFVSENASLVGADEPGDDASPTTAEAFVVAAVRRATRPLRAERAKSLPPSKNVKELIDKLQKHEVRKVNVATLNSLDGRVEEKDEDGERLAHKNDTPASSGAKSKRKRAKKK